MFSSLKTKLFSAGLKLNSVKTGFSRRKRGQKSNDQVPVPIQKLRSRINDLPPLGKDEKTTDPQWVMFRQNLRDDIQQDDSMNFLKWRVIRQTMFHNAKSEELEYLMGLGQWQDIKAAIQESEVGGPRPYGRMKTSSGNLIHQAYSLFRFLETSNLKVSELDQIVEFGGGYGCMCRLVHRLGFKGRYIIFDLPEFLSLQSYYLEMTLGSPQSYGTVSEEKSIIVFLSNIEDLSKQISLDGRTDLFIALWSLSESPHQLRREILAATGNPQNYLIAFQNSFEGKDNTEFFKMMMKNRSNYDWKESGIGHLPNNNYLFGTKTSAGNKKPEDSSGHSEPA
jgi:hypothetical protein